MSHADVSASGVSEEEWHLVQGVVDDARKWWEVEQILMRFGCAHAHESLETCGAAEISDFEYVEYDDVGNLGISREQFNSIQNAALQTPAAAPSS